MNFFKQLSIFLCTIFLFGISINAEAQFKKIKLGKLSDEHKAYKECDFSPGSGAIILEDIGESYNQLHQSGMTTHYRFHKYIKILNKDGLDQGDISFTSSGAIKTLKAATYNEKDGEWISTEFEKANLYKEKIKGRKGVKSYKIPMPNVSVGSIIELIVEIKYPNSFFLPDWYFQDEIPVLYSSYTTTHIDDFIFKKEIKGYFPIESLRSDGPTRYIGSRIFSTSEYKFIGKNLPPINEDEAYAPAPVLNSSHVGITLSEIRSNIFPSDNFLPVSYLDYAQGLLKNPYFGKMLTEDRTGHLKNLGVDVKDEKDILKKAKIIYKSIQEKIEWDEYYSLFPDKSPTETIKTGVGEVADINMLLILALREAGVKAYPLVASTRDNGVPGIGSPNRGDFNYLLCVLLLDDKKIVLDASREGLPFGMVARSVLNKSGYIIDERKYGWVPIQNNAVHEEIYVANLKIVDDELTGTIMTKLGDYAAYKYYLSEDEEETEEIKESFEKTIAADWEWDEVNFGDITLEKPVVVKGKISKEFELEDLIYVEPVLFDIFYDNPFKEEKRVSPIDIPYQIKYRLIYTLEIPEGYVVEEVPASNQLQLPENGASFKYISEEKGNTISIGITFSQNTLIFNQDQYSSVREFYRLFHEQLENMIVLKKL